MGFGFTDVSQLEHLAGRAFAAGKVAASEIDLLLRKTSYDIEADAKRLAPVDTGALKNSIFTTVSRSGTTTTGEIGPSANYGAYQEFGTSRMGAQPYMRPAFDNHEPAFQEAMRQIAVRSVTLG